MAICNKFAKEDNRIKVFDKKNGGVVSARKIGLQNSSGNYIGFVDSDDFIDEMMYEEMLNALTSHSADIVECGFYNINDYGVSKSSDLEFEIIEEKVTNITNIIKSKNTYNQLWNKLYKKEIFNSIDMQDFHYSEDYLTNVQVASKITRKVILEDKFYYYYDNTNGAMNAEFSYKKLDKLRVREIIFEEYCKSEDQKKYVASDILGIIVSLYVNLHNSKLNKRIEHKKKLINTFNNYFRFVPLKVLKEVRPIKLNVSIFLFRVSPFLFETLISNKVLKKIFINP